MGLTEVYRLTGFAAIAQVSDSTLWRYNVTGPQLRENSLLTALIMEALARAAGVDPRAAYTAGLLRSIGKIALDRLTRDRAYGEAAIKGPLAEWESGFIGLNNCEAAAIIMEEWRFPGDTIAAIRDHYVPAAPAPALTVLLNLAAGAAAAAKHGFPGESSYWGSQPEKFAAAGVTEQEVTDATRTALDLFSVVRAAVA